MTDELRIESIICDRLTITGRLDWTKERNEHGEWQKKSIVLSKLFNPIEWQIARHPDYDNGMYSDKFIVPVQEAGSSICIQVNRIYSDKRDFRADFNPSKLNEKETLWLLKILKRIKEKRVTRADMAVNFHHDLTTYKMTDGRQRSSVEFKDRYGNIETLYRGSKNSDNYLKIYNKKKERESKYREVEHDWWRVEETIKDAKGNQWATYEWFKGIKLTNGVPTFGDDVKSTDKGNALVVMNNLMSLDEYSKNYRTKLKKIIESAVYTKELNLGEEIKKAPYQQMLNDALKGMQSFLD
ncbi:hypothetical protein [Bacillus rhizoplanae]|uniref:hypothetical protein n=1 Tax=Bacillus rhizoplanae TaxID=2880966 RepID=UPI003D233D49